MIAKQLEINEVEMSLGASIKAVEVSTHCCLFLFGRTMNTLDSYTKGCGFNSGKVQDFSVASGLFYPQHQSSFHLLARYD